MPGSGSYTRLMRTGKVALSIGVVAVAVAAAVALFMRSGFGRDGLTPSQWITLWLAGAATVALSIWFYKIACWRPRVHPVIRVLMAIVFAAAGAAVVWTCAYAVTTYVGPVDDRDQTLFAISIAGALVVAVLLRGVAAVHD